MSKASREKRGRMIVPKTTGELLGSLTGPLAPLMEVARLKAVWPQVVGEPVAAHSTPAKLTSGRLTVLVDSSPWLSQLTFFATTIRDQVNQRLGDERVKEVSFMVGSEARSGAGVARKKRHRPPEHPVADVDLRHVESWLETVQDETVRDALRALMHVDLRRGRQ